MAEKKMGLALSVTESGKEARKETFTQESVTVGSGDTADLQISGEKVSDIHAMFDGSRGNEVFIMDLGSSSGTFVNDKKVNKQKLVVGDGITLGDVAIEVTAIGDLEQAAAAAAEAEAEPEKVEEQAPAEEEASEKEEAVEAAEESPAEEAAEEPKPEPEPEPEKVEAESKPEPEPEPAKSKSKKDKAKAKADKQKEIEEEEKKALAEKKAVFEAKKAKRKKKVMYDLEVLPKDHKAPAGKERLLEVREVLWGTTLLHIHHFSKPEVLKVGENKSCTYFLSTEYLPTETFDIVRPTAGGFAANFSDQMEGTVEDNGDSKSFKDVIKSHQAKDAGGYYSLPITPGMAVTYKFDEIQYYMRFVAPEKLDVVPFTKRIDYPITTLMVVMLLAYTLMTIYIKSLPAPEVADIMDAPERFAKLILEPVDMEEPPPPPEEEKKVVKESADKSIGEEGKIGKKESVIDKTEGSAKKRLEDEKVANSSGILGALDRGMENMDRLFGGGGLGAGLEKNLGMLEGISGLDMRGAGGLGSRGSGLGGGGMALGIGGLGTKGRGGGKGGRYGIGAAGNLKKRSANINIRTGNPTIAGALDKSIIARIIKKHYSQIRYCYQKELNKNPKLYGKITIKFTIGGAGTVTSSVVNVSTMKNFQVEQCVAKTIKRIIFPRPKGGGIVVVSYPFIFKAEGS